MREGEFWSWCLIDVKFLSKKGMQLQRQAMEQRLSSGNAVQNQAMASVPAATATGQSFLTRTRQAAVRGRASSINQHG